MPLFLIEIANTAVHAGVVILLYSTILLIPGIVVSYALRRFGVALQSILLRTSFIFAIILPFVSMMFPFERYKSLTIETVPANSIRVIGSALSEKQNSTHLQVTQYDITSNTNMPALKVNNSPLKYSYGILFPGFIPKTKTDHIIPFSQTSTFSLSCNPKKNLFDEDRKKTFRLIGYGLFTVLWFGASCLLIIRYIGASISIYLLRRTAVPAKKEFTETCREAASIFGVSMPVILQSHRIHSPLAAGLIKPTIILPLGSVEQDVNSHEVFLHELAHLKRHDYLWNQLRYLIIALFPFQPLLWILSKRMGELADYACDEIVVEKVTNRKNYAMTLCTLSFSVPKTSVYHGIGDGFLSYKSSVRRRIERIMGYRREVKKPSSGISCFFSVSGAILVSFFGCFIGVKTTLGGVTVLQAAVEAPTVAHTAMLRALSYPHRSTSVIPEEQNESKISTNVPGSYSVNTKNTDNDSSLVQEQTVSAGEIIREPKKIVRDSFDECKTDAIDTPLSITEIEALPDVFWLLDILPAVWQEDDIEPDPVVTEGDSTDDDSIFSFPDSHYAYIANNVAMLVDDTIILPKPRELNVSIDFDYENYDYDFENMSDAHKYATYYGLANWKNEPAWSPDGKWIAFTDQNRIWIVSVDGGSPKLIYENFHGEFSVGNIESLCFTPDSRELTFKKDIYDTERGSVIKIHENRAIFSNPIPNVESVDIETGEHRTVVENGYNCAWSPNGRYLCYLFYDDGANAENGDKHDMPVLLDTKSGTT